MVVWGLGMALSDVAGQALLNRVVPAGSIARVTGLLESGKLLFEGAGSLVAPLLVTTLGIRTALIAAGAAVTVVVAASWRSFARIDARAVGRVKTVELVAAVSFFRRLRVDALEGIVAQLTEIAVPAGRVVILQGARNETSWYLVQSGELEVLIDAFSSTSSTPATGSESSRSRVMRRAPQPSEPGRPPGSYRSSALRS
jgi:hypothetical protein